MNLKCNVKNNNFQQNSTFFQIKQLYVYESEEQRSEIIPSGSEDFGFSNKKQRKFYLTFYKVLEPILNKRSICPDSFVRVRLLQTLINMPRLLRCIKKGCLSQDKQVLSRNSSYMLLNYCTSLEQGARTKPRIIKNRVFKSTLC